MDSGVLVAVSGVVTESVELEDSECNGGGGRLGDWCGRQSRWMMCDGLFCFGCSHTIS